MHREHGRSGIVPERTRGLQKRSTDSIGLATAYARALRRHRVRIRWSRWSLARAPLLFTAVVARGDKCELGLAAPAALPAQTGLAVPRLLQCGLTIPRSLLTARHAIRYCVLVGHVVAGRLISNFEWRTDRELQKRGNEIECNVRGRQTVLFASRDKQ